MEFCEKEQEDNKESPEKKENSYVPLFRKRGLPDGIRLH